MAALQAELDRSQHLAALGTIAAMVAHEVNNLMTPVLTYTQLAQAHPEDAALVAKALDRASAGASRLLESPARSWALSKPPSHGDSSECDLAAVVSDAIACVPRGTLRGTRIETQLQPGLRAAIGPASFQQVVLNLLLNSLKALSGKSGMISIRAKLKQPGHAIIEFEDDGPGVSATLAPRVFEVFASGANGTGLGLAMCRRLIEGSGGEIWIDNAGSPGARFCVRLPLAAARTKSVAA